MDQAVLAPESRPKLSGLGEVLVLNWMYPVILAIVAGSIGAGIITLQNGIPSSPCDNTAGSLRTFTIIADLSGFNDSRTQNGIGPLMTVHRCDTVVINVFNKDTQAHGFVIDNYAPHGLDVQPGTSQSFRFHASQPGQFRVYCNSLCSIHSYMLHGSLIVS